PGTIINPILGIIAGWAVAIALIRQREGRESLRDLDEKLRILVDQSPVGNFLVQDGRFEFLNSRIPEFLGYSKEELMGLNSVMDLIYPEDMDKARKIMEDFSVAKMTRQNFEIRNVRKDGSIANIEILAIGTEYKGKPAVIGIVIDISGRKEMEKRQRDFIAMMTHDLKSPLTTILGYSEILLNKKKMAPDAMEMVESIRRSGNRILEMVDYFLTIFRAEAGQLRVLLAPEDPADILKELEKNFAIIAAKKGISLKVEFAPMEKAYLDRAYMERAISNLLQNAFNYAGSNGSVSLSAYSGVREMDGRRKNCGFLAISVSDTGPGIPSDEIGRIFEKYYQSEARTDSGTRGTGLGLAVVKAVAEAHGGRALVESAPGKGSTFKMFLPLRKNA
ncbi:MAG: PAS domain-containing sensor histidine kinase, partial [Nitrospirota bacterium]